MPGDLEHRQILIHKNPGNGMGRSDAPHAFETVYVFTIQVTQEIHLIRLIRQIRQMPARGMLLSL